MVTACSHVCAVSIALRILTCRVEGHRGTHTDNSPTRRFFEKIFETDTIFHAEIYDGAGARRFLAGHYRAGGPEGKARRGAAMHASEAGV